MAEIDDSFASILENCRYSSSQEELLTHSKFARENATFSGDSEKFPPEVDYVQSDVAGGSNRVEFEDDCEEDMDLGFQLEKKRLRSEFPESSIKPPLKKSRVSGGKTGILDGAKVSPLVHCNEKLVIDSDTNKQIVVFKGDVRVEIVSPVECASLDGVQCTVKHDEKKLEFRDNSEMADNQDEGTSEAKNDVGNSKGGTQKGTENLEDGSREEIKRRRNRQLPRSLLGQTWDMSTNESNGSSNGENRDMVERHVEGNEGESSKTDETLKQHALNALKLPVTNHSDEDEMRGWEENRPEKKLKVRDDVGKTNIEGGRENGTKIGADGSILETERRIGQEHGNENGTRSLGNGSNEEIERRRTRDGSTNGEKQAEVERHVEGNGGESSKTVKTPNHRLLDVLKMLVACDSDADEIDIFETAKNRGMKFPRSRFLLDTKKNE